MMKKINIVSINSYISIGMERQTHTHACDSAVIDETDKAQAEAKKLEMQGNRRKQYGRLKKNGKKLLADTEQVNLECPIDISEPTGSLMTHNVAVQKHLIAFSSITRYAVDNNIRIGYGEYWKRIGSRANIKAEWKSIRTWLKKNARDSIMAASIGLGRSDYIYIRFIIARCKDSRENKDTKEKNDLLVYDVSTAFGYYLRRKKHYTPVEFKPYEENPTKFLEKKYINNEITSLEMLINCMPKELYQIMRAGFQLPMTRRTFKNAGAKGIVEKNTKTTSQSRVCDSKKYSIYEKTHSSFLEKCDNFYTVPLLDNENDLESYEDAELDNTDF